MNRARAHVFVEGRVQGVFFRDSTRARAQELGLTGYVRNLADGRVEAVFEGDEAAVQEAVSFIRQGPPFSRVTQLDVVDEPYVGEFSEFSVTYARD